MTKVSHFFLSNNPLFFELIFNLKIIT
uniref:Uncharacterized protein n=1 Tax=Arundo donax TaxID=35708 RepID=A0A0A9C118_ARUDO